MPPRCRAGCGRSRRCRPYAGCGCSSTTATPARALARQERAAARRAGDRQAPMTPRLATAANAGWAGVATRPTSPRPASPTGPT
jgi:hypothetical protein